MAIPSPASLPVALSAHVIGFVILLTMVTRYAWGSGASLAALLGGIAAASILLPATPSGRDVLIYAGVIYLPFAVYPLVLGSSARHDRDPYVAALFAGVWCFLIARRGMALANLDWMVGVVPVLLGAITTLHLSQLLRIEPKGQRDLGRLALVAGAALAFLTVAIPLQLRQQWITIGWALEGAAVAWLYTQDPAPRIAAGRRRPARHRLRASCAQSIGVRVRTARRHAHRQLVSLHLLSRRHSRWVWRRGSSPRPTITSLITCLVRDMCCPRRRASCCSCS